MANATPELNGVPIPGLTRKERYRPKPQRGTGHRNESIPAPPHCHLCVNTVRRALDPRAELYCVGPTEMISTCITKSL